MKRELILSSFRSACQRLILLIHTVSIDENLNAARVRSIHLIQIDVKAAGKGYKVYTLACVWYLYDWTYTAPIKAGMEQSDWVKFGLSLSRSGGIEQFNSLE
jgi:hypothetical protein